MQNTNRQIVHEHVLDDVSLSWIQPTFVYVDNQL
jgi:hypothetical protein